MPGWSLRPTSGKSSSGSAEADDIKFRGGMLACGGNHFSRVAGTELHRTSYNLRNFSRVDTATIERVRVFDANGIVLYEFPGTDLPASVKTELGPYESTQINTADILVDELNANDRPIQAHIKWSYEGGRKDIPINGSTVRTVRAADTGNERSRASSECRITAKRR